MSGAFNVTSALALGFASYKAPIAISCVSASNAALDHAAMAMRGISTPKPATKPPVKTAFKTLLRFIISLVLCHF